MHWPFRYFWARTCGQSPGNLEVATTLHGEGTFTTTACSYIYDPVKELYRNAKFTIVLCFLQYTYNCIMLLTIYNCIMQCFCVHLTKKALHVHTLKAVIHSFISFSLWAASTQLFLLFHELSVCTVNWNDCFLSPEGEGRGRKVNLFILVTKVWARLRDSYLHTECYN